MKKVIINKKKIKNHVFYAMQLIIFIFFLFHNTESEIYKILSFKKYSVYTHSLRPSLLWVMNEYHICLIIKCNIAWYDAYKW
jgi:hypothetical protein